MLPIEKWLKCSAGHRVQPRNPLHARHRSGNQNGLAVHEVTTFKLGSAKVGIAVKYWSVGFVYGVVEENAIRFGV